MWPVDEQKGRGMRGRGGYIFFVGGPLLLLLPACASPQQRRETAAWKLICANAPHRLGQSIDQQEQRAMTEAEAWPLSVAEVDAVCARR